MVDVVELPEVVHDRAASGTTEMVETATVGHEHLALSRVVGYARSYRDVRDALSLLSDTAEIVFDM